MPGPACINQSNVQKDTGIRSSECGSFLVVSENARGTAVIGYEIKDIAKAGDLAERALEAADVNDALNLRLAEPVQIGFLPLYEARLEASNEYGDTMQVSVRCRAGTEDPAELVFYDPNVNALPEVTTDLKGEPVESRSYRFRGTTDFSLDSADMPSGFLGRSA